MLACGCLLPIVSSSPAANPSGPSGSSKPRDGAQAAVAVLGSGYLLFS